MQISLETGYTSSLQQALSRKPNDFYQKITISAGYGDKPVAKYTQHRGSLSVTPELIPSMADFYILRRKIEYLEELVIILLVEKEMKVMLSGDVNVH